MADAPIIRVELFEDRASIVRSLDVPAGRSTQVLEGLTPLVRERGIAYEGDAGIQVEDTQVSRRVFVERDDDFDLVEKQKSARNQARAAEARAEECRDRVARAEQAREAALAWTPRALASDIVLDDWIRSLEAIEGELLEARSAVIDAETEAAEARWAEKRWTSRLDVVSNGTRRQDATVTITVLAEEPGTLRVRYTIPCALWRPAHRATLGDERVHWEAGAVVWNATGEDWTDVELICSTSRPGDHADPPDLDDDMLYTRRREKEVVVEARDESVEQAREGGVREVDEVLGVDDGGEPRTFTAPSPVSLPATGAPIRIPLETWEAPASIEWRAHPELSGLVVLRTVQTNESPRPLLAGPVELYRASGAVGRGEISLIGAAEPFPLCWGSHDGLRVVRRTDRRVERSRITGFQSLRFSTEIRVSHLGREPVDVHVVERIPVSELKEVEVTPPSTEPRCDTGPDRDGFLEWTLSMAPEETTTLRITWSVEAPSHVRLPF